MRAVIVPCFVAVATLSALLCAIIKRFAVKLGVLDLPNGRSMHELPTPRGGGLAIAAIILLAAPPISVLLQGNLRTVIAIAGGGLAVAGVGWLDDRSGLPAFARLIVHIASATWAVVWMGGLPQLAFGSRVVNLGIWGSSLAVVGIVWFINMYNFMDGIDGLAGSEGAIVGLAGGYMAFGCGLHAIAAISWAVSAANMGFLVWNWPPAKIFMGDVGSGFLGFVFGVLAVSSERSGKMSLFIWALLLGVFLVDSTATLLRRLIRGEKWFEPHRTHAYQVAALKEDSHGRVTKAVIGINLVLCALAFLGWLRKPLLLPILVLTYGLLLLLFLVVRSTFRTRPCANIPLHHEGTAPEAAAVLETEIGN